MKIILRDIGTSIIATIVFAVVVCGVYPFVVWGIAQLAFPFQANGSLVMSSSGQIVGSRLMGQLVSTSSPQYFQPRPSAAGSGYDPTLSGGTNLGPTSKKLTDEIAANVAAYRKENGLSATTSVPADAVTSSASGLDPDISIQNAMLQAPRVAKARHMDLSQVVTLVDKNIDPRGLGFLGEPGVNVLMLNIALDAAQGR